ncbi:hypothetical protein BGK70_00495 [Streptomyces agglomeratus]|nr:hypothetical protein BGK70_00495 [Streptomyces agglomeratus]
MAAAPAQPMSDGEVQAKADLLMAMDNVEAFSNLGPDSWAETPSPDPVEMYDLFVEEVEKAQEAITKLKEAGASDEEIEAHTKALKAHTVAYLNSLDEDDLREIAEAKGFEHPALVGLSSKGQHPLVHWLDPAYPGDIPSKAKIQAAALNRYNELLAGKTVGGMTLADLHEIEGTEPPLSGGAWKATPDEVTASAQAVTASIDAWNEASKTYGPQWQEQRAEALQTMLAAEQKLASADCPELGEDLAKTKTEAKLAVDEVLTHTYMHPKVVQPSVQEALASGQLSETEAMHLGGHQLVALMRPNPPESEVESLKALAVKRQEQLANLDAGYAAHIAMAPEGGQPLNLPPAGDPGAPQAIAAWAKNAGDVRDMQTSTNGWYAYTQQAASDTPYAEHPALGPGKYLHPSEITSDFKAWATKQKLSDLRAVAAELGMDNNAKATRAQVQNYIAASFNKKYDQQAIKDKVTADVAKKEAAKAAKTAVPAPLKANGGLASDEEFQAVASKLSKSSTSSTANQFPPVAKPVKAPKPGSFNANIQALMAEVQHVKATSQDLPVRVDAKEVAGWTFGPGTTASNLGGTYAKTIHAAPDGSQWMFKADHNHGGALGHTEAAASHVLSLGGVPAVPVYHHKKADGTAGSIQPLLKDAKPFTSSPSQWTQAQVDAIVRSHVGSWLVGEHDGHQDNWLSTPSGGLVQIDRGQAFKHFGADKLAVDYAPSGGGGFTPVHQKLYQAALGSGLASGVKINPAAAHPVIKKFESMPDAQLRSILHSTAHEGAKGGVAWVPQMRSRAAKALKIPQSQVSNDQIATAFLDHSVERKNNLRQNFSDFFVKQLGLPSGASLKHGGGS